MTCTYDLPLRPAGGPEVNPILDKSWPQIFHIGPILKRGSLNDSHTNLVRTRNQGTPRSATGLLAVGKSP